MGLPVSDLIRTAIDVVLNIKMHGSLVQEGVLLIGPMLVVM